MPVGWILDLRCHYLGASLQVYTGPNLGELQRLYVTLSSEERDELLQCLLVAATRGGEAMMKVLEEALLCHVVEEVLGEPLPGDDTCV